MVENNPISVRERERERELYISTATPDCHAILLGYRADFHDQQPTNMKRPYSSVNVCVCVSVIVAVSHFLLIWFWIS